MNNQQILETISDRALSAKGIAEYFGIDALQWLDDADGIQGGGTMEWLEGELVNTHNVTDGDLTLVYTTDSQ